MPELPELEVLKENLIFQIKDKTVNDLRVLKPYVLKNYFKENLCGEKVEDIKRRGKFLIIELTTYKVIIHLMLHGSIKFNLLGANIKKSTGALFKFNDGTILEIGETGFKKRMAIYVLSKGDSLEKVEHLGIEPLGKDFTMAKLKNMLMSESKQLKHFLCDQKKITGIGNAYADEILWQAKISPFKITTKLSKNEIQSLHQSIIRILIWSIEQVRKYGVSEKREFLNVHNKKGKPCPKCGEPILSVSFSEKETFYCPNCQTEGRKLKDRRLSKFYRGSSSIPYQRCGEG